VFYDQPSYMWGGLRAQSHHYPNHITSTGRRVRFGINPAVSSHKSIHHLLTIILHDVRCIRADSHSEATHAKRPDLRRAKEIIVYFNLRGLMMSSGIQMLSSAMAHIFRKCIPSVCIIG
jgi:hypothetical protein